ncbi:MAG: Fe-S cluster assembly protein SufD [Melioribacteraceae bacterium]
MGNDLLNMIELRDFNLPTTKNEEWKYTNIVPILKNNYVLGASLGYENYLSLPLNDYFFKDFEFYKVVFINGIFVSELSDLKGIESGVIVDSLSNLQKNNSEFLSIHLNKYSTIENGFNELNNTLATDGLGIYVPKGKVVDKPIQILYLNGDNNENVLSVPKNLIVAEENSQVTVIANYRGIKGREYLTNALTEVYAGKNSIVDLYKIQLEEENSYHIEKVQAYQEANSLFNHYNFTFGGSITRNDINTCLGDENIESHFYGLYLAHKEQHIDNHTFVDHAKPNCMSNELYKGILDGQSRGVFNGKIMVRRDAQKTNAYQSNKAVLLSKSAVIDTKPQLEIFADDVKCSHGAAVGQLDENSEFYIKSRGIPQDIAKSMLIRAFAADVIEKIKIDELREQINHLVFEHLNRVEVKNN